MTASFSIVQSCDLKGAKRLDADRYRLEYLKLENHLRNMQDIKPLSLLIHEPVSTGHTPRERELTDESEKVHFIKTNTLREGLITFENTDFLPMESVRKNNYLRQNDVIVTIIGATFEIVGRAAIFLDNYPLSVVNQNIAIIRASEKEVNPFYLAMFLNSKYGREQLWMLSRQTEQVNLNCREVEELLVPFVSTNFQKEIETLYKKALDAFAISKNIYSQAGELLLNNLGLEDFEPTLTKTYWGSSSEVENAKRLDAEYFQPKYDEALERIASFDAVNLITQAKPIVATIKPELEQIYRYVEISDVDISIGEVNFTERKGGELPQNAKIPVKGGELIVSKVRPTRGAIGIVPMECIENGICSKAFSVFEVKSPMREFLQVFLRSVIGKLQLERPSTGTAYPTIKDEDVFNIKVPILNEDIFDKIPTLVKKSFIERRNAKETLNEIEQKINLAMKT